MLGPSTRALNRAINATTRFTGTAIAGLTLLMMLLTCAIVLLRYGFDVGSIALQESVVYLHGTVFMLGMAYCLQQDEHVRVDIFYRGFSDILKAWVDSLGAILFLLPLCALICALGWHFFMSAWEIKEGSSEPGGLPLVFLLKGLIPLMGATLFLQGLANLLKNALFLYENTAKSSEDEKKGVNA